MDEVVDAVEKMKKDWEEAYAKTQQHIKAIENYGKSRRDNTEEKEKNSFPRLNGLAQDGLAILNSLLFQLDLLAPQLPTHDQVQSAQSLLQSWKKECNEYSFLNLFLYINVLLCLISNFVFIYSVAQKINEEVEKF